MAQAPNKNSSLRSFSHAPPFLRIRALENCCGRFIRPLLCSVRLRNGSHESAMRHLLAMISQIRLLGRRRLIRPAVSCECHFAPIVYRGQHTTAIPAKPIPTATRALRRLPTRPILSLIAGGHRNTSYEAGENDSGHINIGPNEGIFFFDSEPVQTPAGGIVRGH